MTETDFESKESNVAQLRVFMREAVGFGALCESSHSSKSKANGPRIKFYVNPILCPRFQLPEARTKEPYYWNIAEFFALMKKARITLCIASKVDPRSSEQSFLPLDFNRAAS